MSRSDSDLDPRTLFTVGHSTRSLNEFIELLQAHGVNVIADVRQHPRSRRMPHFNDESLDVELPKAGIEYRSFKSLGGRRRAQPDSINAAWRNDAFRGYADYMQTDEFRAALDDLVRQALGKRLAIMCAEAVPWRCHRSLIADALTARGWTVLDIINMQQPKPHALAAFARIDGDRITYPASQEDLFNARWWLDGGD